MTVSGFNDSPLRFDQLVLAINEGERLLGVPYPSPEVIMRRVDQVTGGFCGYNQLSYAPRYAGESYVVDGSLISVRIDEDCDETFATIAHEVAHTWFHGNDPADWIDEGLANAIENQVGAANQQDQVIYPPVTYCTSYRNILELERGVPKRESKEQYTGFSCNYTLGDGIFGALKEHYGDSEFNARIANLARGAKNDTNDEYTITDVRKVLGEDGHAIEVINRWYDGQPEMRKYRHLDSVQWTFPPTIDGEYLHFAGRTDEPGMVHDFELGPDPYCSQFSLYDGVADQEWVSNVSDPLPAGWRHDEDSKVISSNWSVSTDTGEFSVTARILDNALDDISELSLAVGSRVTTGADGKCQRKVNYSQIPVAPGRLSAEVTEAKYLHMDAIKWTHLPTMDGEYLHFAGKTSEPGMVHDLVLGPDPYCSQFALYEGTVNQEWVTSVSSPLRAGWSHHEIPKVVVVNHKISEDTREFSVTAKINDNALDNFSGLSLAIRSRVATGADGLCGTEIDYYSQVPVVSSKITDELKATRHYHLDAIQWIDPPTISGNTLTFSGKAASGTVDLEWRDGYCSQFSFYERDERGYHYIDSLNPYLPGNRTWTGPITGEVTRYRTGGDGTFDATAELSNNALSGYRNLVLVVRSAAAVDRAANRCGESEILSAIDIR